MGSLSRSSHTGLVGGFGFDHPRAVDPFWCVLGHQDKKCCISLERGATDFDRALVRICLTIVRLRGWKPAYSKLTDCFFCSDFFSNVFFFAIIIIVSQAFPLDLYLATFYIAIVGTLFIAALSLIVLFSPKFWGIWKSMHQPWGEDGHPSQQSQGRLGGGGGFASAAAMGRMPGDIKVSRREAIAPAVATSDLEMAGGGRDSIAAENVFGPVFNSSRKRSFTNESITTTNSGISKIEGNPVGAWMNSRMPQKGSAPKTEAMPAGTFSTESLPLDDGVSFDRKKKVEVSDTAVQAPFGENEQEHQIQRLGRLESEATDGEAAGDDGDPKEPLRTALRIESTFGSSSSGAHRMVSRIVS